MIFSGKEVGWVLACYVMGCFTAGYYWVKWRTGRDVREQGSGNVGARNVGRLTGATGFAATFIIDLCKGALAVVGAQLMHLTPEAVTASLMAVILGHNWPCQLRFRGGKGVAVSLGALLCYDWFIVVILISVFLPLWAVTRIFTLSGMLAYVLAPLLVFLSGLGAIESFTMSVVSMLVVFAHHKNIREELGRLFSDDSEKRTANRPPEQRTS